MADRSYTVGEAGASPEKEGKDITYNEDEYLAEVGEMNCYCVPTRVYGFKDFVFRTLGWTILNKEQILGAFTGKLEIEGRVRLLLNIDVMYTTVFTDPHSLFYYSSCLYPDSRGCDWRSHCRCQPCPCSSVYLVDEYHHFHCWRKTRNDQWYNAIHWNCSSRSCPE